MALETFQKIRRHHVVTNTWADVGYHAVIDQKGKIYAGRKESVEGAHVRESAGNVASLAAADHCATSRRLWSDIVTYEANARS
jgi:hypothetical protein